MNQASPTYFTGNRPLKSLIPAIKALITSPRSFFEHMPSAIYRMDAIFFFSFVIFTASFLSVPFFSMIALFLLPAIWGVGLVGLWLWSKYLSWAVRAFSAHKLSTANAFQLSAYAALPMAFSSIPYLGLIAGLWTLYLLWLALVARYKLGGGAAVMIVLIPVVLFSSAIVEVVRLALKSMA